MIWGVKCRMLSFILVKFKCRLCSGQVIRGGAHGILKFPVTFMGYGLLSLISIHVGGTQARLLIICAVVVSELPFLGCVIEWNF